MTSLSDQTDNGVNGTKKGIAPGKIYVEGPGTPGRHPATVPTRLKISTWNVKTSASWKTGNCPESDEELGC